MGPTSWKSEKLVTYPTGRLVNVKRDNLPPPLLLGTSRYDPFNSTCQKHRHGSSVIEQTSQHGGPRYPDVSRISTINPAQRSRNERRWKMENVEGDHKLLQSRGGSLDRLGHPELLSTDMRMYRARQLIDNDRSGLAVMVDSKIPTKYRFR